MRQLLKALSMSMLFVLTALSGCANAKESTSSDGKPLSATITFADKTSSPVINWELTNHGDKDVYVAIAIICDHGGIDSPLFRVNKVGAEKDDLNASAPFISAIIERRHTGVVSDNDFVVLAPGASKSCRINLRDFYDLPKDGGTYEVYYHATNMAYPGKQPVMELKSNFLRFTP